MSEQVPGGIDKELINQWLDTLETGGLKQTTGRLVSEHRNSYCCLGVLCKVSGLKTGVNSYGDRGFLTETKSHMYGEPDQDILDRIGMANVADKPDMPLNAQNYMTYNDDDRLSFKEIAAKLREEYKAAGIL